jgi:uncharacterized protein (TIGR03437 family)
MYLGASSTPPASCLPASLSGSYVFSVNGYQLASGLVKAVGTIFGLLTFDGMGGATSNFNVVNGTNTVTQTASGTFVETQCGGAVTLGNYDAGFMVSAPDASVLNVIITSTNYTSFYFGWAHATFANPGAAVELAAGSGSPVPPGSLFSIYGSALAAGAGQASGFPLPTALESASVTVNGEAAPLYYVSPGVINAQMPLDIKPGLATVVVTTGSAPSNAVAINIPSTAAPGVFVSAGNHAAAQNLPSYATNSESQPASVGESIVVYFTGGGTVQGQAGLSTGQATPAQQFPVTAPCTAALDGTPANVTYCGLVPTAVGGFYQADLVIPNVAPGDHNLVITIGAQSSAATVISTN